MFAGAVKHLEAEDRELLMIEAMSTEALTTSEIEGELLDRASVQASIRRQLGLEFERRRVKPGEQGIAEMVVDLYCRFAEPLFEETLFRWHEMVMKGRGDMKAVGVWRREAMEVVSGALHARRVHFEAPPSSRVGAEMGRFVEWFQDSGPGGGNPLPALTRAGIAHLHFESIHPFEDGNGRIGRAISEKAMAQSATRDLADLVENGALVRRGERRHARYFVALGG